MPDIIPANKFLRLIFFTLEKKMKVIAKAATKNLAAINHSGEMNSNEFLTTINPAPQIKATKSKLSSEMIVLFLCPSIFPDI